MGGLCTGEQPVDSNKDMGMIQPQIKESLITKFLSDLNKLRSDPGYYAKLIETNYLTKINGQTHVNTGVTYFEGVEAFEEVRQILKNTSPMPLLKLEKGLVASAFDHATFLAQTKIMDVVGRGGSSIHDRMQKYGKVGTTAVGESSIMIGSTDTQRIIVEMLADDGIISRKNRTSLLDKRFKFVGYSLVKESGGECVIVVDFAEEYDTDPSKATSDVVLRAEMELNK